MEIFKNNCLKAMKKQNISQRRLAKEIGVTPQSLWIWLNKTYPPIDRFLQICNALKVTPNDLLEFENNVN